MYNAFSGSPPIKKISAYLNMANLPFKVFSVCTPLISTLCGSPLLTTCTLGSGQHSTPVPKAASSSQECEQKHVLFCFFDIHDVVHHKLGDHTLHNVPIFTLQTCNLTASFSCLYSGNTRYTIWTKVLGNIFEFRAFCHRCVKSSI